MNNELRGLAGALFAQCPQGQHRVLLAVLERVAADQYRRWAEQVGDPHRAGMLDCARREEEVAAALEGQAPEAVATARAVMERFPDLPTRYRSLLEGRSLGEQFAIQATGERAGGELLRSYALADAAELEDANAAFLDQVSQELPS